MGVGGSLARMVLAASVLAGASYLYTVFADISGPGAVVWKGMGVALLALYAALNARNGDGWLLAIVMAFGALGDVLLETAGMVTGAVAFVLGHVTAIALYLRNRRAAPSTSQKLLATIVLPASVVIAIWSVPFEQRAVVGTYTCFVGAMAAAAWISRFPRYRTGIGAMMFLVSDLLIFARIGLVGDVLWVSVAIWGLYYFGQLLIALGVVKSLAEDGRVPTTALKGSTP